MKKLFVFLTLGLFALSCSIVSPPASKPAPTAAAVIPASPTSVPATPAALALSFIPSNIWMMDSTTGWGFTYVNRQNEISTYFLRTLDGGRTWHDISPAPVYATESFALDSTHAWLLSPNSDATQDGTLYRTSDGGQTWQSFLVPFGGGSLRFFDDNEGWATYEEPAGTQAISYLLFRTSDGGMSWTQAPINEFYGYSYGTSGAIILRAGQTLAFSKNTIWIVSDLDYPWVESSLYTSWNNGKSWQSVKLSLPAFINVKHDPLGFESPVFVTGVLAYLPLIVNDALSVFVSNDGGRTWALRKNTVRDVQRFARVDFVSELDAFVLCGENICVTHDGAQTWQTVKINFDLNPQTDRIVKLDFVNAAIGWAVVSRQKGEVITYTLLKSADGGATWITLGK